MNAASCEILYIVYSSSLLLMLSDVLLYQEKEKTEHSGDSNENTSSTEKPKAKQVGHYTTVTESFFCCLNSLDCTETSWHKNQFF